MTTERVPWKRGEVPISASEIFRGIREGIVPDKPGIYFNLFKEHLDEVQKSLYEFGRLMITKYELTAKRYETFTLPNPGERQLARELADRQTRLFSLMHRHLLRRDLLVPRNERIKYAREEPGYLVTRDKKGVVIAKEYGLLPPYPPKER